MRVYMLWRVYLCPYVDYRKKKKVLINYGNININIYMEVFMEDNIL